MSCATGQYLTLYRAQYFLLLCSIVRGDRSWPCPLHPGLANTREVQIQCLQFQDKCNFTIGGNSKPVQIQNTQFPDKWQLFTTAKLLTQTFTPEIYHLWMDEAPWCYRCTDGSWGEVYESESINITHVCDVYDSYTSPHPEVDPST